jgi:asparagine synthase (glutamine-hydrolysing)
VEFDGRPVDSAVFLKRFDTLAAYGPDLSEQWIDGPTALGRQLLRLSPASFHEKLDGPIDDLVVVADAVLDNRSELAAALDISSPTLAAISDTEIIRRAFRRWGPACVDRLIGDFAFAAVRPNAREVFLATDHIGARPLYWALRGQTLVFSTALKAIVDFTEWSWPIDERVIAEHLFYPLYPASKPFFSHIQTTPAGGSVFVKEGRATVETWWRPSTKATIKRRPDDAIAECRTHLERAIADRVAVSGHVGAHLSGGVDSTGVSVIAARQLNAQNRSLRRGYTWSPPVSQDYPIGNWRDERDRINRLASGENIELRFGEADGSNMFAFLERPFELEGEADLADEIPVLRAAREDGLRVMLSGWGGDEAFSAHGRGYLASLVLSGQFKQAKRFAHTFARSLKRADVLLSLAWREVIYLMLPSMLSAQLSPYRNYFPHRSFISSALEKRHADLRHTRGAPIKFGIDPIANLKTHMTSGHVTMRMASWAAWSAPYGFQYRYPLTDKRLLEFLFTLQPEHLYMNDQPRGLARRVLADCIPESASKDDVANERFRRDARGATWSALATQVASGNFSDDCPWLDGEAFRRHALNPVDQSKPGNSMAFGELFFAARVWSFYRRAVGSGWV